MDSDNCQPSDEARTKLAQLDQRIEELGAVCVAFSGGVDSTFLLARAASVLGDRALAVTVSSPLSPSGEVAEAHRIAEALGVRHTILELDPLDDPQVAANEPDRCYYCKRGIIATVKRLAHDAGIDHVLHGEHAGDAADHRPGSRAARELGAIAPLAETGLGKSDIRALSKEMGLPGWNRPSMACLASRIPYGEPLTEANIQQVRRAEDSLRGMVGGDLRVRHHGALARVEIAAEQLHLAADSQWRDEVLRCVKQAGYTYAALDLEGFRSGSANEIL